MNQSFLSDITMRQCHIATFCTCSLSVLLYLVLFLRYFYSYVSFTVVFMFGYVLVKSICAVIEKSSGQRPSSSQNFLTCHWNLNSIMAHSYVKISLLKPYLSIHLIQFVCQKHNSTPVFLYMMSICKYRVMNQSDWITHRNIKGVVYVSVSVIPFH